MTDKGAHAITDQRLPAAEELLRFERLLSELSAGFINLPVQRVDEAINDGLRRIVETLGIDRSTLTRMSDATGGAEVTQSYAVEGIDQVRLRTLPGDKFPWALARLKAGKPIVFSRIDDLPPEASVDREGFRHILKLKSHVTMPLIVDGAFYGGLSFACIRRERAWSDELLGRMRLLAEIFGNTLARKRAQEEFDRALQFERLLTNASAKLLGEPIPDSNAVITRALQEIGEFLDVERAQLWSLSVDGERFERTHFWAADGVALPSSVIAKAQAPTIFERIVAGEVVALSSSKELPAQAYEDRDMLRRTGARSLLIVPLVIEGFVVGAFSLASVRIERAWPGVLIPRVRLIGEVFAGVVARKLYAWKVQKAQSETAQYRERLAHLVRVHTVGEMSAAIAHEVNQPLVAIENYALAAHHQLTAAKTADMMDIVKLLESIAGQAARAGEVLKRLRAIVQKHDSEETEFDLGQLVADTTNLVEMESRLKDVRIEIAVKPGLPSVLADQVQIQQVVLNLARNAIEAMDDATIADKMLKVEVDDHGERLLVVRVVDRGKGVSPIDREHIFEPFYSTKETGLGIGLAICRSIVEARGGKLSYAANSDGGTTFQFTLPVAGETPKL